MNPRKRFLTVVFTVALGLGVWTLAFTFQSASFSAGDTLSASALNTLLNDNFQAASDAVDGKVDKSGDTMSGRLDIVGDAVAGEDGSTTLFRVTNEGTEGGSAALFTATSNAAEEGAVSVMQGGSGPALSLKSGTGGGPLIVGGFMPGSPNFIVEQDGSIKIDAGGGADGTDPALHLDATAGTITNDVGSGLPVAFGSIAADGTVRSATDNVSAELTNLGGDAYVIIIDGVSYDPADYVTVVTSSSGAATQATTNSIGGSSLSVYLFDESGNRVASDFHFVTFAAGS